MADAEEFALNLEFNTREALCFSAGMLMMLAMFVLYYFGFEIPGVLVPASLTMMGLPIAFHRDEKRKDNGQDS